MLTTPTLKSTQQQGSAMITASYSFNNKINTFNQVVSFARINSNSSQGGVFSSGANIIGYGNSMGYATVYLYGSGANQVYTINSITSNNSGVQIVNGNITGKQLASNSVQAVEVSAPTNASTSFSHYATSLIVKSTTGGRTFNSLSSIEVTPSPNGAILTSGIIPLINTAVANPAGSMFIVNSGNATATSLSVAYPVGSVASTGSGECTTTLAVGAGCRIYFNLTEQKEGSGNIIVTYAGGSIASSFTQTVVWFNGIGGALLQMIANPNPIVVSATVSGTVLTTVTNIGGYNLTGMTAPAPSLISGSATGTVTTPIACTTESGASTGNSLPIGGSCSYTITLADSTTETGDLLLNISGNYNNGIAQTYSRGLALAYTSLANAAILIASPTPTAMSTIGNNINTSIESFTITNVGTTAATINDISLASVPAFMNISATTCIQGNVLSTTSPGNSCSVQITLGPVASSTELTGSALFNITYTGGQASGTTASYTIPYTIQPNQQSISIESVTAINSSSGTGADTDSFIFNGYNLADAQSIIITYLNSGTDPIQITGVNNINSPSNWMINTTSSCYSAGGLPSTVLVMGATCTIIFDNQLYQNSIAVAGGLGASYSEPLTVPTLTFIDYLIESSQFTFQPAAPAPINGTIIYATANQAVITNVITLSYVNSLLYATIANTATNMLGYTTPFPVTSTMEDYFSGTPVATNCTPATPNSGIQAQTCNLSSSNESGFITYAVVPAYYAESLHVSFTLSTTPSQTVSMSPLYSSIILVAPSIFSPTVFSGATVTSTGGTRITGDVDVAPGTSITGLIYSASPIVGSGTYSGTAYTGTDPTAVAAAATALSTYQTAVAEPCTNTISASSFGAEPLAPGVYCFTNGGTTILNAGTLTLTGESTSSYVFKIPTLTTTAGSIVVSSNNIPPSHIVWAIDTAVSFGSGTTFYGLVDAQTAISDASGSSITGYLWGGAGVTLINTTVSPY